jgi:mono/diheme cytochrome c family protein
MPMSPRSWRVGALALLLAAGMTGAQAQGAGGDKSLNKTQLEGMALFNQHCRVCHTKPLVTAGQYGPVLSSETLGGDASALHSFIAEGTPRMPGFQYSFAPAEIDAVVAYIKTVPAPANTK